MAKQNKIERKAPQLSDNGGFSMHDLSHYFGFKCSTGHAVPVFADLLNPNERIKLKVNSFVRLQPMLTPAFLDLEASIDYFFVPLEMLYMPFGRNFSNTREFFSSFLSAANMNQIKTNLPLFNGYFTGNGSAADLAAFVSFDGDDPVESFLSEKVRLLSADGRPAFEAVGNRVIRLFDYLGYDLPSVFTQPVSATALDINDYTDITTGQASFRPDVDSNEVSHPSVYRSNFPWKLLSYNAIWENWYRLDDFIQYDNQFFNVDRAAGSPGSWPATGFNTSSVVLSRAAHFAGIKYVPKHMDYFTSSVNNPVVQKLNIVSGNLPFNNQWLSADSSVIYSYYDDLSGSLTLSNDTGSVGLDGPTDGFLNMARLRLVKAQEKMLQIYGRLPKKNYDNFVYALFGAKVPHDVKHELSHLGSEHFKINVGQITNMAASSEAPLGEFAGQGAGSLDSRGIKFTAPVHGVVMAIQSIKPRYMYAGGFLRENYVSTTNDFFLPPYDNLGRQPVFGFERGIYDNPTQSTIIGWQFRWQQNKSRVDRVTRAFQFGSDRSWFLVNDNERNIVAPQSSLVTTFDVGYRYVDPCSLNDIMAVQFNPFFQFEYPKSQTAETWDNKVNYFRNPQLLYYSDPFIVVDKIQCTKFSKMSVYSLQTID